MDILAQYRRQALKGAVVVDLGGGEGYAAQIPGFRGLIATGPTKQAALLDLKGALKDWIDLALKSGHGLPALRSRVSEAVSAR